MEKINGLYYHEVGPDNSNKSNNTVNDYIMVKTVKGNKSYFTTEEIKGEDGARRVQQVIGCTRNTTLKHIIKKNSYSTVISIYITLRGHN